MELMLFSSTTNKIHQFPVKQLEKYIFVGKG